MLTVNDLAHFIETYQIQAEIVRLVSSVPTVPAAAAAVGAAPDQIVKSVLFLVNGTPQLVLGNGLRRIDQKLLAAHLGVGRKRVKLANPAQVLDVTGFLVGTVPPFGHKTTLPTLIEAQVALQTEVYAGGGGIDALVRLAVTELMRVVGTEVVAFAA